MTETMIDYESEFRSIVRLCVDIETAQCHPEDLDIEKDVVKASGNFKDTKTGTAEEKKAKQIAGKRDKVDDDDGKLDMNPIACIGVDADGEFHHFSWFTFTEEERQKLESIPAVLHIYKDEYDMLKGFRKWLDARTDEFTVTITWNGYDFDNRRIRFRYAVNNLAMPMIYAVESRNRHLDMMHVFCKYFTVKNELKKFCKQQAACKKLKIESQTKDMEDVAGAKFPKAIANGLFYRGSLYNLFDVDDLSTIAKRLGY